MTDWNPRAVAPQGSTEDYIQWLGDDLTLFQRTRPELPQGAISRLSKRDAGKVIRAWNRAREAAELEDAKKVSPEYYQAVERFHRTRTVTLPLPKVRKPRTRKLIMRSVRD